MSTVDATFYVQVEPVRSHWNKNAVGEYEVTGAKAVRITQSRPQQPAPGAVMVKLTVRLPATAFDPLRPEAVVIIPDSMAELAPIEVEAQDPSEPQP